MAILITIFLLVAIQLATLPPSRKRRKENVDWSNLYNWKASHPPRCVACHGTGKCSSCHGAGCMRCDYIGDCDECDGSGLAKQVQE